MKRLPTLFLCFLLTSFSAMQAAESILVTFATARNEYQRLDERIINSGLKDPQLIKLGLDARSVRGTICLMLAHARIAKNLTHEQALEAAHDADYSYAINLFQLELSYLQKFSDAMSATHENEAIRILSKDLADISARLRVKLEPLK